MVIHARGSLASPREGGSSAWGRAEIRGSTPCKAICFVESSAITDFSQRFSLHASTPKSVNAAQSLRPCRDHCPQSVEHLTAAGKTASRSAARCRQLQPTPIVGPRRVQREGQKLPMTRRLGADVRARPPVTGDANGSNCRYFCRYLSFPHRVSPLNCRT